MTTPEVHRIDVTVDIVLFTLKEGRLHVVLSRRTKEPFKAALALPGGYVHAQEDADSEAAAARVLATKAGLVTPYLEQLYTFADGKRDPRGWSVSISYFALVPLSLLEQATAGTEPVELHPVDPLPALSFDHARIVTVALDRLRTKSSYSTLPLYLVGARFTLTEVQRLYEEVLGHPLETANFRRWLKSRDILVEVKGAKREGPHRAAQVFKLERGFRHEMLDRSVKPPKVP